MKEVGSLDMLVDTEYGLAWGGINMKVGGTMENRLGMERSQREDKPLIRSGKMARDGDSVQIGGNLILIMLIKGGFECHLPRNRPVHFSSDAEYIIIKQKGQTSTQKLCM
jgi:hypothetical protein